MIANRGCKSSVEATSGGAKIFVVGGLTTNEVTLPTPLRTYPRKCEYLSPENYLDL